MAREIISAGVDPPEPDPNGLSVASTWSVITSLFPTLREGLGVETAFSEAQVSGNEILLARMIVNVVDNAVRYCPIGVTCGSRRRPTGGLFGSQSRMMVLTSSKTLLTFWSNHSGDFRRRALIQRWSSCCLRPLPALLS
jgi:hypothetical protein